MDSSSTWTVAQRNPSTSKWPNNGPLLAWARDQLTGAPVYVLELGEDRAGGNCRCECPSCQSPLIAVNAAKTKYLRRPHFRHARGAESSDCLFLAARLAALRLLQAQGLFMLPMRRMSGNVVGLSGTEHEAWVEVPSERVRISHFDFSDRVAAILTLDDGRMLRVQLTGSASTPLDPDSLVIPTILLELNDSALASMSPEELRDRLTLVPESFCWASHWDDAHTRMEAEDIASKMADSLMDLAPADTSFLEGVDPAFRRETLLHLEVKKILAEASEIMVPALSTMSEGHSEQGERVECSWERSSEIIPIEDVKLEQRFGRVIPDVIARIAPDHGDLLMIEITVTNQIGDERLSRIREINCPTLEIDLRTSGGLLSRAELKALVLYGLEAKRWLHHPFLVEQNRNLDRQVAARVLQLDAAMHQADENRRCVLATPLEEIAQEYLDCVASLAKFEHEELPDQQAREAIEVAKGYLRNVVKQLEIHGYPEAGDELLTTGRQGIVARILSIKENIGIGYRLESAMAVMNAIRQSTFRNRSNHTLYLIAERVYRDSRSAEVLGWYSTWVNEIKASIDRGESTYIRDGRFDKLLAMLFPDMAPGLANGYGTASPKKRTAGSDKQTRLHGLPVDFNVVLREAQRIGKDMTYAAWFRIWDDRYMLNRELRPIAEYLLDAGYPGALRAWQSWYAGDQRLHPPAFDNYDMPPRDDPPIKVAQPTVNSYALAKGRDKPRN
jgi:hypothetical protein